MADEEILSIPIDASDLPPALKILEQISAVLQDIEKKTNPFDKLSVSVNKSNKELEKTSKLFDNIFGKIKLSKLASEAWGGIKQGAGTASLTLGGVMAGLVGMAVYGTQGATNQIEQSRRWGLGLGQFKALGLTSEKMGKAGMLEGTMGNLVESMRDIKRSGAFASLGLNQRALQGKDPVSAMFEVLNTIKNSPLNNPKNPLNFALLKDLAGQMGITDPDLFLTAIREGASRMQGLYAKDAAKLGGLKAGQLERGEYALIDFRQNMEMLTWKIGGAFAPALVGITNVLNNLVDKYGGKVSKFITDTFTESHVKDWTKNIEKFISVMGRLAKWFEKTFGWMIDEQDPHKYDKAPAIVKFAHSKSLLPEGYANKKISEGLKSMQGILSNLTDSAVSGFMALLNETPADGSTISELNKTVVPGSVLDALNQPAPDKKSGMSIGEVHIHIANFPNSAKEVEYLISGLRAQAKQ